MEIWWMGPWPQHWVRVRNEYYGPFLSRGVRRTLQRKRQRWFIKLQEAGWTQKKISAHYGISAARVGQIIRQGAVDALSKRA